MIGRWRWGQILGQKCVSKGARSRQSYEVALEVEVELAPGGGANVSYAIAKVAAGVDELAGSQVAAALYSSDEVWLVPDTGLTWLLQPNDLLAGLGFGVRNADRKVA